MISYGNRMIVNMGAVQSIYRKDEGGVPHQGEAVLVMGGDGGVKKATLIFAATGHVSGIVYCTLALEAKTYRLSGTVTPVGKTVRVSRVMEGGTGDPVAQLRANVVAIAESDGEGHFTIESFQGWEGRAIVWAEISANMLEGSASKITCTATDAEGGTSSGSSGSAPGGGSSGGGSGGSGSGGSSGRDCPECGGTGTVQETCTTCGGTGGGETEPCTYCGGTGLAADSGSALCYYSGSFTADYDANIRNYAAVVTSGGSVTKGHKLKLAYDGSEYQCTSKETDAGDALIALFFNGTGTYAGNYGLLNAGDGGSRPDTGEPVLYVCGDAPSGGIRVLFVTTESGEHALGVYDMSCSACGGSGVIPTSETCPDCGGMGYVEVTCPTCGGSGVDPVCLSGDTEITMADGSSRRLDKLAEGDLVMGGDGQPAKVLRLGRGVWNDRHTLYHFANGTVVDETHEHRFFNVTQGFWQKLKLWRIGDRAERHDGAYTALVDVERIRERAEMFGLWVERGSYWANGLLSGDASANLPLLENATAEQAADMAASLDERALLKIMGLEDMMP